ncbi:MAG: hypothetical protein ABI612_13675, partial [Betaproteobacteria bacterium]
PMLFVGTKYVALTPTGATATSWPNALSFVHVETTTTSPPEFGANPVFGTGDGQEISPALLDVFLPARKDFMLTQLNAPACLCRSRFNFLTPVKQLKALRVQEAVDTKFHPQFSRLSEQLTVAQKAAPRDATGAGQAFMAQVARLNTERDDALRAALKQIGVSTPAQPSTRVQPLKLTATKLAGKDKKKLADLRQQQVIKLVKEEPPRRTVTGSFTIH